MEIPVVILERHVHLRQDIIEQLFCHKYHLHPHAQSSQPPDFLSEEFVTLVGPHGRIPRVRVYGPPRADNQVEISQADALLLGIRAPLRESGDIGDTPGIVIEGPRVCVRLDHGVIRVLRHLHLDPAAAARHGLADHSRADVTAAGGAARTLFCDVLVRVSDDYRPELHVDAEEARAAGLDAGSRVEIGRAAAPR